MSLKNIKIGDKVMIECYSGLGSGGSEKVTNITTEKIIIKKKGLIIKKQLKMEIIWCNKKGYSAKDGTLLTHPTSNYYLAYKL